VHVCFLALSKAASPGLVHGQPQRGVPPFIRFKLATVNLVNFSFLFLFMIHLFFFNFLLLVFLRLPGNKKTASMVMVTVNDWILARVSKLELIFHISRVFYFLPIAVSDLIVIRRVKQERFLKD
jgi:hypothetical protein